MNDDIEKIIEEFHRDFSFEGVIYKGQRHWKDEVKQHLVTRCLRQALHQAQEHGRTMKGSSWREGYERGKAEERDAILALRLGEYEEVVDSVGFPSGEIHTAQWKKGWNDGLNEYTRRIKDRNTTS